MARQTSVQDRIAFYQLHQHGIPYIAIAEQYRISMECVRYWCRQQKNGGSPFSHYLGRRAGLLSSFDPKVKYNLLKLKLKHPRWGPNRILVMLRKMPSLKGVKLPSEAQIGRYLHQWPRFCRQEKPRRGHPRPKPPTQVHQRWQLDFKTGIVLADQTTVNLHTIRDPVGEACLMAMVYVAGEATIISQAQNTLRHCFAKWHTLPREVQTDHEANLVAQRRFNDFPTVFTLWLCGLDIQHLLIRPGRPTDNAEVERCHRTIYDYAIAGNEKEDLPGLQKLLLQAVDELAFELPSRAEGCAGQAPAQAHPQLLQPPHPFQPEWELACFDLNKVDAYLATFTWERTVSKNGQVHLGSYRYSVGRKYARQSILIRFDPQDRRFIFLDPNKTDGERVIQRRLVRGLSLADLTGFDELPCGLFPQQLPLPLAVVLHPEGV